MTGSLERPLKVSETWPKVTSSMSSKLIEAFPVEETRFSEPRISAILDLMNKLQLPFSHFTLYFFRHNLVNRIDLVTKRI